MPAKAARKKQPQINSTKPHKILTQKSVMITILLLIIAGSIFYWLFGGRMNERAQMESYLENKYGQRFVVDDPVYKNSGLGVEGIWEARAHPVDDSDLRFRVGSYKQSHSDQYIGAIWSKKLTPEFESYVSSVYDRNTIDASMQVILSEDLAENATRTSPTLDEAKTRERGFLYKVVLIRKYDNNEPSIAQEASLASRLLALIHESGVKKRALDYTLVSRSGAMRHCMISSNDSALDSKAIENCIKHERI